MECALVYRAGTKQEAELGAEILTTVYRGKYTVVQNMGEYEVIVSDVDALGIAMYAGVYMEGFLHGMQEAMAGKKAA